MIRAIFSLSFTLIIFITLIGCNKTNGELDPEKVLLGKWDCINYADSHDNVFKNRPPVFISNYYESGYFFKRNNFLWTRYVDGDGEMLTNKEVDCSWSVSDDKKTLSLIFPDNSVEVYEIIDLQKKEFTLLGVSGFWAANARTYIFEKAN